MAEEADCGVALPYGRFRINVAVSHCSHGDDGPPERGMLSGFSAAENASTTRAASSSATFATLPASSAPLRGDTTALGKTTATNANTPTATRATSGSQSSTAPTSASPSTRHDNATTTVDRNATESAKTSTLVTNAPNPMTVATTQPPTGGSTTGTTGTTAAPNITSVAPPITSVAPPITSAAPNISSVAPPITSAAPNITSVAPPITSAAPVIVCPERPCPPESVCLGHTCACVAGTYFNNGVCVKAQVFPGRLRVVSRSYSSQMSNRSSPIFQKTAAEISAELSQILGKQKGYIRSEVIQLTEGSVIATVDNIYQNTDVTEAEVNAAVDQAIASSNSALLTNATYQDVNLCQSGLLTPCDVGTTSCAAANGQSVCSCLPGYVTINQLYSNSSCKACPSGQRAVQDTCQPCPFGYAGFNCNDSSLLAVVVVSCVLGGILLILILVLIVFCCLRGCSSKSESHFDSPYSVNNTDQPWPSDIRPIPRATTHWESGPSIELTEGRSTNDLVGKKNNTNGLLNPKRWKKTGSYDLQPDDMKTFKGKNASRYSYLVQGHENPYFMPGDESRK
ncbi:protein HEG homolog 1 [Eucyclogobius newberryi]|uniref:protein HEG homolog 1 n=1 Tax=Eucyclogobius newberryi TaxID=166745 RepID=UPI003B58B6F6